MGRTGSYIAIDAVLQRIKAEGVMDVVGYTTYMRAQRSQMVQTEVGKFKFLLVIFCFFSIFPLSFSKKCFNILLLS